jgi:CheY-like chemotaxis protein
MDGFELIAALVRDHPGLPVVVMTALSRQEAETLPPNGVLQVLRKPIDPSTVAGVLLSQLGRGACGKVTGVSLASFVQVLELERKTCTLQAHWRGRTGTLFIVEGELYDAEFQGQRGLDAAYQILTWESPSLEMDGKCHAPRAIHQGMRQVLLEAARRRDEANRALTPETASTPASGRDGFGLSPPKEGASLAGATVAAPPWSRDALAQLMAAPGAEAAAVVNAQTGCTLAGTGLTAVLAPEADLFQLIDAVRGFAGSLVPDGPLEEVAASIGSRYHLLRPLPHEPGLFLYLAVTRLPANLSLAREVLARTERHLAILQDGPDSPAPPSE